MFLNIETHKPDSLAAIDDKGGTLSYGELISSAASLAESIPARSLVFAFTDNSLNSLIGYYAFLNNDIVPLLLDSHQDPELSRGLIAAYRPAYLWLPAEKNDLGDFRLVRNFGTHKLMATGLEPWPLDDRLALLITTSGSTGSPKLVRQTRRNLESNAGAIAEYLEIKEDDRPISTLPMNYVYGLSIVNSHLLRGACLLLTNYSLMQKEFWNFLKEKEATSIAGVPYTYEMLKRLRFFRMELPSLRTMTQAGGKLLPELHREFAQYALEQGKRFVVMYGAAEATARMGYLPAEKALEKYGSMGLPIPGGRFSLLDEAGREIDQPDVTGELVYHGDNVTLGYAVKGEDLANGDEWQGRLETGDMVRRDADGFYYVVGRKKRFLKIFGNRVGLDETERLIKSRFPDLECACLGRDDLMRIFITEEGLSDDVKNFITQATRLNQSAFQITEVKCLPKNEAGKTLYAQLEKEHGCG